MDSAVAYDPQVWNVAFTGAIRDLARAIKLVTLAQSWFLRTLCSGSYAIPTKIMVAWCRVAAGR